MQQGKSPEVEDSCTSISTSTTASSPGSLSDSMASAKLRGLRSEIDDALSSLGQHAPLPTEDDADKLLRVFNTMMGTYSTHQEEQLQRVLTAHEQMMHQANLMNESVRTYIKAQLEVTTNTKKRKALSDLISDMPEPGTVPFKYIKTGPNSSAPVVQPMPPAPPLVPFVSKKGVTYPASVFPQHATCKKTQSAQLEALSKLEEIVDPEQLKLHNFDWKEGVNEWIPKFESFWRPKRVNDLLTIRDVYEEHSIGKDGKMPLRLHYELWGARWKRQRGNIKTESSRRLRVVQLVQALQRQPGWDEEKVYRFMDEKYPSMKNAREVATFLQKSVPDGEPRNLTVIVAQSAGYV